MEISTMVSTGPVLGGTLVKNLGFPVIVSGLGFLCFAYSPFLTYLKDPPARSDKEKLDQQVIDFYLNSQLSLTFFRTLYLVKRPTFHMKFWPMTDLNQRHILQMRSQKKICSLENI